MRIVMEYSWKGVKAGSRGKILNISSTDNGSILTVKFDDGTKVNVPKAATISEIVFDNQKLESKIDYD